MSRFKQTMTIAIITAAAAAIGYLLIKARNTHNLASQTVEAIEAQIRALDPVTRADVIARLSADAVKDAKSKGH